MDRLHQLLHALDSQQVKVLKNYLTGFSTRDANTKFWELAALLLKDKKVPPLKVCSIALYGVPPDARIARLKNRLYVKVLDSLLIDINTNRDIYEDEAHPVQVRLRKKMILYDLLKFTPLKETVGMEMITDIIAISKQYEFYPILLDAQYILKWTYGMTKGIDFFQKKNAEIAYYEKCKHYAQRALDLYTELAQISTFNTKADKIKLEQFIIKSIDELKQYYIETRVKSVGYYLKTFELTLHLHSKNNEGAKEVAIDIIGYLKQNKKTIGRKGRFGILYGYLAEIEIEIGNYDSAVKYLHKGREYFSGSQFNLSISKKLEADAYFLKGDYQKTMEIAVDLASGEIEVTGNFRRDMMLYYKGCCHFMLGEFREAARLFNLKFQLTQDKLGWEVNIRFMRIMTMLEVDRPDEAHAMVETTSKHIERYQQVTNLSERDKLLLKLFRELAKEGFSFDRPNDKIYHYLLQLQEKDKDHSWEPLTPELIPIHTWVIKKYGRLVPPAVERTKKEKIYKTAARKRSPEELE